MTNPTRTVMLQALLRLQRLLLQGCASLQASADLTEGKGAAIASTAADTLSGKTVAWCDRKLVYARAASLSVTVNVAGELSWLPEAAGIAVPNLQLTAAGCLVSHRTFDQELQQTFLPVASLLLAEPEQPCLLPRLHLIVCVTSHTSYNAMQWRCSRQTSRV